MDVRARAVLLVVVVLGSTLAPVPAGASHPAAPLTIHINGEMAICLDGNSDCRNSDLPSRVHGEFLQPLRPMEDRSGTFGLGSGGQHGPACTVVVADAVSHACELFAAGLIEPVPGLGTACEHFAGRGDGGQFSYWNGQEAITYKITTLTWDNVISAPVLPPFFAYRTLPVQGLYERDGEPRHFRGTVMLLSGCWSHPYITAQFTFL